MECPSCGGRSLTTGNEGLLICDDCDEQFAGYRGEELDDAFAGTAVSTRQSQASQAEQVRARIAAAKDAAASRMGVKEEPSEKPLDEELCLCEGVFLISKAIAKALVNQEIVPPQIYEPLFEIVSHWVERRHAGVGAQKERRKTEKSFRVSYILSLVCLAALYIRSPLLPRDVRRLVALNKIPYLQAAKDLLPPRVFALKSMRKLLCPKGCPSVSQIRNGMLLYTSDEYAWPPLKSFFNEHCRSLYAISAISSLPVGNVYLTLWRLVCLLGLPDSFGERVLRYMDLRKSAIEALDDIKAPQKTGRVYFKLPKFKSEPSMVKESELPLSEPFSWRIPALYNCCEYPTDRTLQIDFINTLRVCYGRYNYTKKAKYVIRKRIYGSDYDLETIKKEWDNCIETVTEWLYSAGGDDADIATWTAFSPETVSTLKGERLKRFLEYVESAVSIGADIPAFLRSFASTFQSLSSYEPYNNVLVSSNMQSGTPGSEGSWPKKHGNERRHFGGAFVSNSLLPFTQNQYIDDDQSLNRSALVPPTLRTGKVNDARAYSYLWDEPLEMSLIWTIIRLFFSGSVPGTSSDRARSYLHQTSTNLVDSCNKSLKLVVDYVTIYMEGKSKPSRTKKRRKNLQSDAPE